MAHGSDSDQGSNGQGEPIKARIFVSGDWFPQICVSHKQIFDGPKDQADPHLKPDIHVFPRSWCVMFRNFVTADV